MKHVIIGTAGHVDHGKTALIKALTGIDTDRLQEEKKRGITIELGFAHLDWPDGTQAGIVDVPGHEKFIRNMLAGAGGIDLAMLVVAADEGFMPQTVEHLQVLEGVFHFDLHHIVNEMLVAGALGLAQQQLHRLPMVTDVVHHPVDTLTGLQPHVLRLLLLRQFRKGSLRLHEPPHQSGGVWLHDGGKECLFAGKITIKCASGDTGLLHDLPQGGTLKAFL